MDRLTHLFPGLRDPLACAGLLLAIGLYTTSVFLPAFKHTTLGGILPMSGQEGVLFPKFLLGEVLPAVWEFGWKADPFNVGPDRYCRSS